MHPEVDAAADTSCSRRSGSAAAAPRVPGAGPRRSRASDVVGIDAVGAVPEQLAGDVGAEAVGQMPTGLQRHARAASGCRAPGAAAPSRRRRGRSRGRRPGVASAGASTRWDEHRPEGDEVGVDPAVGLGVGVVGSEQRAGELVGTGLDGVDVVAAGVQPVARRALRRTCRSASCPSPAGPPGWRSSRWRSASGGCAGRPAPDGSPRRRSGSTRATASRAAANADRLDRDPVGRRRRSRER